MSLSRPFNEIESLIKDFKWSSKEAPKLPKSSIKELRHLESYIIGSLKLHYEKNRRERGFAKISRQVAHDIRSPIVALESIAHDFNEIDEQKRLIVINVINRIKEVAQGLLHHYQDENKASRNDAGVMSVELISPLLESVVNEKRFQIRGKPITINFAHDSSQLLCAAFNVSSFKRVISNLLNNAVDSFDCGGQIELTLRNASNYIQVQVTDNGCGIPGDQLPVVIEEGVSFGKENGTGLGLPYVVNCIEQWHGDYEIHSIVDEGTAFEFTLPMKSIPDWLILEAEVKSDGHIILVDDDRSIHELLKKIIIDFPANMKNINVISFYDPYAFIDYSIEHDLEDAVVLVDYNFRNYSLDGIQLIDKLHISHLSILLTNDFYNEALRRGALERRVKILPKPCLCYLKFKIKSDNEIDLVLLDDLEAIRLMWELEARKANKRIATFDDPDKLITFVQHASKNIRIYVDSDLKKDITGQDVAERLYKKGYKNIYLTTAYEADSFSHMLWIRGIIGKTPPFVNRESHG